MAIRQHGAVLAVALVSSTVGSTCGDQDEEKIETSSRSEAPGAERSEAVEASRDRAEVAVETSEVGDQSPDEVLRDEAGPRRGLASATPSPTGESLRARLLGTIIANDPLHSSALLQDADDYRGYSYGVGDAFQDWIVIAIRRDSVTLQRAVDAHQRVTIERTGNDCPPLARPTHGPPVGPPSGIVEVEGHHYVIDRAAIASLPDDRPALVLHRGADGQFDGYRLATTRGGTVAEAMGFRNGDIVHSIEGESLTPPALLSEPISEILSRVQTTPSVCAHITRRRAPLELCWQGRGQSRP